MPQSHRAESAIVRPRPATGDQIEDVLMHLGSPIGFDAPPTTIDSFIAGMEMGLALALDRPEAVPLVLATIDARRRSIEADDQLAENVDARVEISNGLADVATGAVSLGRSVFAADGGGSSFEWN